jgi:hypothetical protein
MIKIAIKKCVCFYSGVQKEAERFLHQTGEKSLRLFSHSGAGEIRDAYAPDSEPGA